jgi:hypothetical protein
MGQKGAGQHVERGPSPRQAVQAEWKVLQKTVIAKQSKSRYLWSMSDRRWTSYNKKWPTSCAGHGQVPGYLDASAAKSHHSDRERDALALSRPAKTRKDQWLHLILKNRTYKGLITRLSSKAPRWVRCKVWSSRKRVTHTWAAPSC